MGVFGGWFGRPGPEINLSAIDFWRRLIAIDLGMADDNTPVRFVPMGCGVRTRDGFRIKGGHTNGALIELNSDVVTGRNCLHVLAHEMRHVWQFRTTAGRTVGLSEHDAEEYAQGFCRALPRVLADARRARRLLWVQELQLFAPRFFER